MRSSALHLQDPVLTAPSIATLPPRSGLVHAVRHAPSGPDGEERRSLRSRGEFLAREGLGEQRAAQDP